MNQIGTLVLNQICTSENVINYLVQLVEAIAVPVPEVSEIWKL
jgi:hypothetical protein